MTEIPENFLHTVEFLPDGSATQDQKVWLKAWSEYATKQLLLGRIKLFEIEGFNEETGEVPTAWITELYLKKRTGH